jgi:hypothetical protein
MDVISQRELRNNSSEVPPELQELIERQQSADSRLEPARKPFDLAAITALAITPRRPLANILEELRADR